MSAETARSNRDRVKQMLIELQMIDSFRAESENEYHNTNHEFPLSEYRELLALAIEALSTRVQK